MISVDSSRFISAYTQGLIQAEVVASTASPQQIADFLRSPRGQELVLAAHSNGNLFFKDRAQEFCLLLKGHYRDTLPPSVGRAIDQCWNNKPPRILRDLQPVFDALADVYLAAGVETFSEGVSGLESGRPSLYGLTNRDRLHTSGVPTLPGTRQGIRDFQDLISQLLEVGLLSKNQKGEVIFNDTIWLKAPGYRSNSIRSLEDLQQAFNRLVENRVAHLAVAELYISDVEVIEASFSAEYARSIFQSVPTREDLENFDEDFQIRFFTRDHEEDPDFSLLPYQRGLLRTTIDYIVEELECRHAGVVKFLFDRRTNSIYFLKVRSSPNDF